MRTDTWRLNWMEESGKNGRFPGRTFDGGWTIRDLYGTLLGEGETLREAIDNTMDAEGFSDETTTLVVIFSRSG